MGTERKVLASDFFLLKNDHVDDDGNGSYQFLCTIDDLIICISIG